jgi:hypothetical protein
MEARTAKPLCVLRVAVAGAATAAIFYGLCWLGSFLPVGPATHAYLSLFAGADITTLAALLQGICWSIAFGSITGGLFAVVYNAAAGLDRG